MKKLSYILFLISSFLFSQGDFSDLNIPDCQILLLDETGIKETNGAIYKWKNQVLQKFHAVQPETDLRPVASYEPWPGHVTIANETVANKNERQFLSVPDYREDINFDEGMTVFYVGKSKDFTLLTQLVGTMKGTRFTDPDTKKSSTNWTGWRLSISATDQIKAEFGDGGDSKVSLKGGEHDVNRPIALSLQYSDKNIEMHQGSLDQVFSGTLANDYVKNDVPLLLNGQYGTTSDLVSVTANYEIASVIVFNRDLDSSEHDKVWDWLRIKYRHAFAKGFGLEGGFVGDSNLPEDSSIEISFNKPLSQDTGFPNVYKNSLNENPVAGTWEISEANKIRFLPTEQFQKGSLIVVDLFEAVTSAEGELFENTKERYFSNIIETSENYDSIFLDPTIKTVQQQDGTDHEIPLEISIPKSKDTSISLEPTPVVFWVHGGAWTGGTVEKSYAQQGTFSSYLVKNVGVAVVGVAYRCKGSNGNFTKAMEDVESAVQWVRDNAEEYNIDVNKMGFAGGSAGGPLSALQAQRTPEALLYVGFNGIFDFTLDDNSSFGGGNNYGQRNPGAAYNSAAKNIRENPPYTLLLHGSEDTTIDPLQSVKFAKAINAKGGTADVKIYDGEVHSFFSSGQMNIPCTWEFKEACEKAFAQKTEDNLIIKSIYNQSSFKSVNNKEYYFTIVEFEVLNSSINLNNYSLRYDKGDGTNETNRVIGNFDAKIVHSYNKKGDPVIKDSDGILNIGDSFYCVEMRKIGRRGTFSLTNLNLYNIIAEYFDFSEADMIDKKHFTNATVSTENFDKTIHKNSSKITLREKKSSGNFSIIDVWEGGLAKNNSTIRTTLTPTTTYTPSQWGVALAVNNKYNDFENETIQNPVSSGDVLTFQSMTQKEIRLYAITGELLDVKHNIFDMYVVPNGLIGGLYYLRIIYDNAREKTQKLVVN